jgi:flavin reductase (DIM6/NTAB) family NADH-FMN oxidoreductase RutF
MELDPATIPQADRYKVLIGAIVPRPIAWVSTISPDGRPNLAPFSFFSGVSSEPMALLFCPANNSAGEPKDTLRNILASARDQSGAGGQFVVNIVPHGLGNQMSASAEELPYGESEFDLASLAQAASRTVKPPRVADSPVCFECEALQVIRLAPGVPGGGNIVIGRVLWIHARDGLVNERHHVDPAALDALGRMAGITYCSTRDRLDILLGRAALGR